MTYTVHITETNYTSVSFNTKEEAEEFINEPDYDMCRGWEIADSQFEIIEDN
jgi:hypothetical protein